MRRGQSRNPALPPYDMSRRAAAASDDRPSQGHLVIAGCGDERDRGGRMSGEAASGGGDLGGAGAADETNGGVAQGRHHPGRRAAAHERLVFGEGNIAHPVRAVLDAPVVADQVQEAVSGGPLGCQAGDAVDHLLAHLTGLDRGDLAVEAEDLLGSRPVRVARQVRARTQAPLLAAAVTGVPPRRLLPGRIAAGGGEAKTVAIS